MNFDENRWKKIVQASRTFLNPPGSKKKLRKYKFLEVKLKKNPKKINDYFHLSVNREFPINPFFGPPDGLHPVLVTEEPMEVFRIAARRLLGSRKVASHYQPLGSGMDGLMLTNHPPPKKKGIIGNNRD